MQVKSIAECSPWSILQYFGPPLSYHLSLRPLFCLFLSGRFTQVLLHYPRLKSQVFISVMQEKVLTTLIKLPFVIKTFALSIFERPFYTGFTILSQAKIFIMQEKSTTTSLPTFSTYPVLLFGFLVKLLSVLCKFSHTRQHLQH